MPKNRYDPLLFLPYSLSVACQGKTTPEPSGTRLSFETHRTGEFRNVPGASKQDIQHMVKAQRILLKKVRKKAPNFSHQEFRRVEKSRVQRLETAQSHSLIAYLKKTSSWEPTIARTIRTYIKNMATLLNARRSPTVRLLSGIGSSMSFCQRTGPQKTMTKKQNGPADCSASPFTFLWCEGENRLGSHLFVFI